MAAKNNLELFEKLTKPKLMFFPIFQMTYTNLPPDGTACHQCISCWEEGNCWNECVNIN